MEFTRETLKVFLEGLPKGLVHSSNILAKLNAGDNINLLLKCGNEYHNFFSGCDADADLDDFVDKWNGYLNFVRRNNKGSNGKLVFSSQSKFESTILEEVLCRLFKKYESEKIKVGGIKAFSNMFFTPTDFERFKTRSDIKINTKDQDFAIYKQVDIRATDCVESTSTFIPVFAVECKTYLDKTMLEGSVATADKIKSGNPYCRFCIVTERYDVDRTVDIKNSRIDQIYILKKDAKKSNADGIDIAKDVVRLLRDDTEKHLNSKWTDMEKNIREKGIIFDPQ